MISLDVLWFVAAAILALCIWLLNRDIPRSERSGLSLLPSAFMLMIYVVVKAFIAGEPK